MIGRIDLKEINTVLPQLLSTILSAQSFKIQPVSNTCLINDVLVMLLSVIGKLIQMNKYVQLE